jgi:hypothetical protein
VRRSRRWCVSKINMRRSATILSRELTVPSSAVSRWCTGWCAEGECSYRPPFFLRVFGLDKRIIVVGAVGLEPTLENFKSEDARPG